MYTRVSSKELLVPPELETANCSRAVEWTEGVHAHHGILHSSERKEVTTACGAMAAWQSSFEASRPTVCKTNDSLLFNDHCNTPRTSAHPWKKWAEHLLGMLCTDGDGSWHQKDWGKESLYEEQPDSCCPSHILPKPDKPGNWTWNQRDVEMSAF